MGTVSGPFPALRGILKDLEDSWLYSSCPKVAGTGIAQTALGLPLTPLQGGHMGGGKCKEGMEGGGPYLASKSHTSLAH